MAGSIFRGVFLTSDNPSATAKFYAEIAGVKFEEVSSSNYTYWKYNEGDMQIAIHDAKSFADYAHPANSESNLTHLYFKLENKDDFLRHLEIFNLSPHIVDEFNVIVLDPDGRKVLFGTT